VPSKNWLRLDPSEHDPAPAQMQLGAIPDDDQREPRRNLRPKIAARSLWARIEAILRNREFLAGYRDARARWIAGAVT
jgi:hypothetical protein